MIKKIIGCLIFCTLLISCNKERNIHIKAINPVTNEPYANLRVVISSSKTGFDGEVVKTVYDGTLNSNGEVMVPLRIKKNRFYIIRCEQPVNTCYTKDLVQYYAIQDEQNPSFLFEYAECANLKFRYHNIDCQGPDDYIKVNRYTNLEGYVGFIIDAEYDGCADYTMPDFVAVPMGWWYFEWEVTKNNITEYYSDSIYLTSGEFKEYTFEY